MYRSEQTIKRFAFKISAIVKTPVLHYEFLTFSIHINSFHTALSNLEINTIKYNQYTIADLQNIVILSTFYHRLNHHSFLLAHEALLQPTHQLQTLLYQDIVVYQLWCHLLQLSHQSLYV